MFSCAHTVKITDAVRELGLTAHAGHCLLSRIYHKVGTKDLALLTRGAIANGMDEVWSRLLAFAPPGISRTLLLGVSTKQVRLIRLLTLGVRIPDAARELSLVTAGGYAMLSSVYRRLGLKDRALLTRWAIANGIGSIEAWERSFYPFSKPVAPEFSAKDSTARMWR